MILRNETNTDGNYAFLEFRSKDTGGTARSGGGIMGVFPDRDATGVDTELAFMVRNMVSGSTVTEAMRIDINGDIGIGTSSPDVFSWGTHTLTLYEYGATNSNANIDIIATGTGNAGIIFGGGTTSGTDASIRRAQIWSEDGSILAFGTNASDSGDSMNQRMTIMSQVALASEPRHQVKILLLKMTRQ